MKYRTLLHIQAVIAACFGAAGLLAPARLLSTYDVELAAMGLVIYQFWGAALLGLGWLAWIMARVEQASTQRAVALALFVLHGINAALALQGQTAGANAMGWSVVALFVLLSTSFGYFRFVGLNAAVSMHLATVAGGLRRQRRLRDFMLLRRAALPSARSPRLAGSSQCESCRAC